MAIEEAVITVKFNYFAEVNLFGLIDCKENMLSKLVCAQSKAQSGNLHVLDFRRSSIYRQSEIYLLLTVLK